MTSPKLVFQDNCEYPSLSSIHIYFKTVEVIALDNMVIYLVLHHPKAIATYR